MTDTAFVNPGGAVGLNAATTNRIRCPDDPRPFSSAPEHPSFASDRDAHGWTKRQYFRSAARCFGAMA